MRLRRLAASAAVLAVLAGCSSDGGTGSRADTVDPVESGSPTATATPSPTPAGPRQATTAQVKAALLSVADLPTGWSREDDDDDDDDDLTKGCRPLAALDDPFGPPEDIPDAEAQFSRDELGPFLGQSVGSLESAEEVSAGLAKLKKAFSACPKFSYTDDEGKKQRVEIAPVSFPKLGDETLAARLSLSFEGGTARMTVVVVRVRNHALAVFGMSVTTVFGGGQFDPAEFEKIARAAVRKVDRSLP